MNKTALVIIIIGLVLGIGIIFMSGLKRNDDPRTINSNNISINDGENIEIKDGIQYITIDAKGGYSPKVSSAQAGIPTKLIIKTNNTYDCSSSLRISSVGFQKILPKTGEEIIDLGIPKTGEPIRGVCGMGMYSFLINFN
jgi:plastocyanin domain-containing protein